MQNSSLYRNGFNSIKYDNSHFSYIIENQNYVKDIDSQTLLKVLFISDVQNYVPIKLCKTSDSIHSFKIKGTLKPRDIKLNRNYLWDTFEINWNKIILTFNDNKIDLPKIITIKM